MTAFVGGTMQTITFNPATATSGTSGAPFIINGSGLINLLGTSGRMGGTFAIVNMSPAAVPTPGDFLTGTFNFGSVATLSDPNNTAGLNGSRGTYIDRTNFGARSQVVYNNGANTETSQITDAANNIYSTSSPTFSLSRTGQVLVTANTVGANTTAFLSSISSTAVTPCTCEYTQWGFWSANTSRTNVGGNIAYSDRNNLVPWVAGIPAQATDIPTVGTATYTGHAIANISNNGSQYVASGTFSNQVNFGTRLGQVQVGNLDGATYTGAVNLAAGTASFAGSLTSAATSRIMNMGGQFFQGGPTNTTPLYGEMGGFINITGPGNYLGGGVFAGRKP
jgi:hypothetical protein